MLHRLEQSTSTTPAKYGEGLSSVYKPIGSIELANASGETPTLHRNPAPNKAWGANPNDAPLSMSR